jgi:hypothetical protein
MSSDSNYLPPICQPLAAEVDPYFVVLQLESVRQGPSDIYMCSLKAAKDLKWNMGLQDDRR